MKRFREMWRETLGVPRALCSCAVCACQAAQICQWFLYNWGDLTPGMTEPIHTPFSSPSRVAA